MGRCERAHHLGLDRVSMEPTNLMGSLDNGPRPNPLHYYFLLEHQTRRKGERQSVGSDYLGMDCAFPSTARKFCSYPSGLSRSLRIQPSWTRTRFHDAK